MVTCFSAKHNFTHQQYKIRKLSDCNINFDTNAMFTFNSLDLIISEG